MIYGGSVLPQHQELLEDSAIAIDVAEARKYVSVDTKDALVKRGFPRWVNVPGLLIPIWPIDGSEPTAQYRSDRPSMRPDGQAAKYVNRSGGEVCLDVNPIQRDMIQGTCPIVITEGSRKVDAGISVYGDDILFIGLLGVDCWGRVPTDSKGEPIPDLPKVPLADWKRIPLAGREICIIFDSDVSRKHHVQRAIQGLIAFLVAQGALTTVSLLPEGPEGGKVGLDDYLATGGRIELLEKLDGWSTYVAGGKPEDRDPHPGEPFPLHVYPTGIRDVVTGITNDLGCPLEFVAAGMLVAFGSALGRHVGIHVGGGWYEHPCIWVALVGSSGTKKDPAIRFLMQPLRFIDAEYRRQHDISMENWKEVGDKQAPLPPKKQLIVNDITIERLGYVMKENPRGLILAMGELMQWSNSFDQYRGSKGSDRQKWLTIFTGSEPLIIQRVGTNKGGVDLYIPNPMVAVLGGLQPSLIRPLVGADGLHSRLLYAVGRGGVSQGIPKGDMSRYWLYSDVIERLEKRGQSPWQIKLDPEALQLADDWIRYQEDGPNRDLAVSEPMQHVHRKMLSYVFRFAIILNQLDAAYLRTESNLITADQFNRSLDLVHWFEATASSVLALDDGSTAYDDQESDKRDKLRKWIADHPGCTRRMIMRKGPRWAQKADVLSRMLKDLGISLSGYGSRDF